MIKLIRGHDKRSPIDTLALDDGAGLSVAVGGLALAADNKQIIYGPSRPGTITGQSRIRTARQNGEITITIRANGGDGPARIAQLQRDLAMFGEWAAQTEEARHGPPVYLAYRINDGLETVPEPVIGQWSTYTRVLAIFIETWPENIMEPQTRKMARDLRVRLVTAPYSEGAKQVSGFATGAVRVDSPWGVIVTEGKTDYNRFLNPSFSAATYTAGWSNSGAGVFFPQETRPGFTRGHGSAVLVGAHDGANVQWYQSRSTSTERWYVSFYAKRLDGMPVTSADCEALINGSAVTSYYIDNKDGWYRVFGAGTGSGGASSHGVEVKAGHSVVVDEFQLEEYPSTTTALDIDKTMPRPYWFGHRAGAVFDGSEPDSNTDTTNGQLYYDIGNEISGFYTIAGWFTPTCILPADSENHGIFSFRESAGEYLTLYIELVSSSAVRFVLAKESGSVFYTYAMTQHTPIHLAVTQDDTEAVLFINGVRANGVTNSEIRSQGGTLTLGYGQDVATTRSGWAIDGFRVFPAALTEAQLLQLHDNEASVKANGGIIGMPTYMHTYDGAGLVENDNDTINDDYNHMEIGGVNGDLPAETQFEVTGYSGYGGEAFWLGRAVERYNRGAFKVISHFHQNGNTTTDGGRQFIVTRDTDLFAGRISAVIVLAITGSVTQSDTLELWTMTNDIQDWPLNDDIRTLSYGTKWAEKTISINSVDIEHVSHVGDMHINFPDGFDSSGSLTIQIDSATMPTEWSIERTYFMPYPNIWVNQRKLSSDTELPAHEVTVINGPDAYARRTFGDFEMPTETRGDGIELLPGYYNHVYFMAYDQGKQTANSPAAVIHDQTDNFTITVYTTPRYTLPGGPLA